MASAGEFDSDEFATNLFSDLAPLLALFGEEVTTQFLSMSMGWADNLLLAMGPVGIITIVISAIRIGGSKRLKSLVGRARETRATAEMELLSSTSASVCEMWNGRQVTRIIGEPKGMATVVIAPDGGIYSLSQAYLGGMIKVCYDSMDMNIRNKEDGSDDEDDNSEDDEIKATVGSNGERVMTCSRHDDCGSSPLEYDTNFTALDLPTNLTLNTRTAPVSKTELWSWAVLGIILQAMALVFPGITTCYLKWNKGDVPVADYGYPCFAVGTVALTIGTMLCGHIIEGATQETKFALTKTSRRHGLRFLCLQKARSIGSEDYPSCAIFLSPVKGILSTSRRGYVKYRHTWNQALISTSLAIPGYIVQFIGLRTLHWSASIFQLTVTIIMAIIRAWARRYLATEPRTSDMSLQSHYVAWLTQLLRFQAEKAAAKKNPHPDRRWSLRRLFRALRTRMKHREGVDDNKNQFLCELISLHSEESSTEVDWLKDKYSSSASGPYARDSTGYVSSRLLQRVTGPLRTSLGFHTGHSVRREELEAPVSANSLETYARIVFNIPKLRSTPDEEDIVKAAEALRRVIEKVMTCLSKTKKLAWKCQIKPLLHDTKHKPLRMYWGFDIREGRIAEYHQNGKCKNHIRVILGRKTIEDFSWYLDESNGVEQLQAAIALSLYTDAFRHMCASRPVQSAESISNRNLSTNNRGFRRIVGYATSVSTYQKQQEIQEWLEMPVESWTLPVLRKEDAKSWLKQKIEKIFQEQRLAGAVSRQKAEEVERMIKNGVSESYLGAFLSSSADQPVDYQQNEFKELLIRNHSQTPKAFQYAQEMFSLFILAVASEIQSVRGVTREIARNGSTGGRLLENSLFKKIAEIVCEKEEEVALADSMDEAYALIIPAFAKHGLLPDL